jgi:hypothetical protein
MTSLIENETWFDKDISSSHPIVDYNYVTQEKDVDSFRKAYLRSRNLEEDELWIRKPFLDDHLFNLHAMNLDPKHIPQTLLQRSTVNNSFNIKIGDSNYYDWLLDPYQLSSPHRLFNSRISPVIYADSVYKFGRIKSISNLCSKYISLTRYVCLDSKDPDRHSSKYKLFYDMDQYFVPGKCAVYNVKNIPFLKYSFQTVGTHRLIMSTYQVPSIRSKLQTVKMNHICPSESPHSSFAILGNVKFGSEFGISSSSFDGAPSIRFQNTDVPYPTSMSHWASEMMSYKEDPNLFLEIASFKLVLEPTYKARDDNHLKQLYWYPNPLFTCRRKDRRPYPCVRVPEWAYNYRDRYGSSNYRKDKNPITIKDSEVDFYKMWNAFHANPDYFMSVPGNVSTFEDIQELVIRFLESGNSEYVHKVFGFKTIRRLTYTTDYNVFTKRIYVPNYESINSNADWTVSGFPMLTPTQEDTLPEHFRDGCFVEGWGPSYAFGPERTFIRDNILEFDLENPRRLNCASPWEMFLTTLKMAKNNINSLESLRNLNQEDYDVRFTWQQAFFGMFIPINYHVWSISCRSDTISEATGLAGIAWKSIMNSLDWTVYKFDEDQIVPED